MKSVMHMIHGVNHRLEMCGQWVVDRLHISRVREGLKIEKADLLSLN